MSSNCCNQMKWSAVSFMSIITFIVTECDVLLDLPQVLLQVLRRCTSEIDLLSQRPLRSLLAHVPSCFYCNGLLHLVRGSKCLKPWRRSWTQKRIGACFVEKKDRLLQSLRGGIDPPRFCLHLYNFPLVEG